MRELFAYEFFQAALIAAVVTGLAAPSVGTYLVQRRLALLGDGIGHVAVSGVALGLLTGTSPVLAAIIVAIMGAVAIEWIRARGRATADMALALLFYGGIAGGVLLVGLSGQGAARLHSFLFGSISTISPEDLRLTVGLAALTVAITVGLRPWFFAAGLDADYARVSGVRVGFYNTLLAVLAAVTVTISMRTVGLLLVSALMIVPVATAQQLARSFRVTLYSAMGLGAVYALGGLLLAAWITVATQADVAPGPTIVLLALAGFVLAWPVGAAVRRRARRLTPFPHSPMERPHLPADEHDHEHSPDCGHPAVPHGDHLDYLHNGHRHASHGAHYDEH